MLLFRVACAAALLAGARPVLAANAEDGRINAVYAGLSKAHAAADVDGITAAFDPGALLLEANSGSAASGAELPAMLTPMVKQMRSNGMSMETAFRVERRSMIGNVAVDAGYMRTTMTRANGPGKPSYTSFLLTMQRDARGAWHIVSDASMPADKAAFDAVKRTDGLEYEG